MADIKFDLTPFGSPSQRDHGYERGVLEVGRAHDLYERARIRSLLRRVWTALTGRPTRLLELAAVEASGRVRSRSYGGLQTVPVHRIQGSVNRSQDFDAAFNPLQDHTKQRWVRLAAAREAGECFPAIELIQVGDVYYVQDGHHRVSIARALGEKDIDAIVTVWQVAEAEVTVASCCSSAAA